MGRDEELSASASAYAAGGILGVEVKASAEYKYEKSSKMSDLEAIFEKNQGEIQISEKKCIKDYFDIRKGYRALFLSSFVRQLDDIDQLLCESSKGTSPTKNEYLTLDKHKSARQKMINFVNDYGTSYAQEIQFGAALRFEHRYLSRSKGSTEKKAREKCASDDGKLCVSAKSETGQFECKLL